MTQQTGLLCDTADIVCCVTQQTMSAEATQEAVAAAEALAGEEELQRRDDDTGLPMCMYISLYVYVVERVQDGGCVDLWNQQYGKQCLRCP